MHHASDTARATERCPRPTSSPDAVAGQPYAGRLVLLSSTSESTFLREHDFRDGISLLRCSFTTRHNGRKLEYGSETKLKSKSEKVHQKKERLFSRLCVFSDHLGLEWHLGVVPILVWRLHFCEFSKDTIWGTYLQVWRWTLWGTSSVERVHSFQLWASPNIRPCKHWFPEQVPQLQLKRGFFPSFLCPKAHTWSHGAFRILVFSCICVLLLLICL